QGRGVHRIYGGDCCTFEEQDQFFSFRRDGQTGRMVSLIWRDQ
ncbi:MAG: laccase domain-containing protein, partial [Gammaproteobacteria bacterium]|nr:laccase domain-containing protein [Gammaproteobacteria bacterium]